MRRESFYLMFRFLAFYTLSFAGLKNNKRSLLISLKSFSVQSSFLDRFLSEN